MGNKENEIECYLCGNMHAIIQPKTGGSVHVDCPECLHYVLSDLAAELDNIRFVRSDASKLSYFRKHIKDAIQRGEVYTISYHDIISVREPLNGIKQAY